MAKVGNLRDVIDYFIHVDNKSDYINYTKSKSIVVTFLMSCAAIGAFGVYDYFLKTGIQVSIYPFAVVSLMMLLYFRKSGDIKLVGGLTAVVYGSMFAYYVSQTGGLHSVFMPWLIISPLRLLYFRNRQTAVMSLSLVFGFTYWQYAISDEAVSANFEPNSTNLLFVFGYFMFYTILFAFFYVYEGSQKAVIADLKSKKNQLKESNSLLEEQKGGLELQKLELEIIKERLTQTNVELEKFAYAASHDLKEPLRMIGMYTQLAQRRLKPHMDETTTEFMAYVTDGVDRMQNMLDDLLKYSRIGKDAQDLVVIDLNKTLRVVTNNLAKSIQQSNATVNFGEMPKVMGYSTEMVQLFQNLISNGLKYQPVGATPVVEIKMLDESEFYLLSISDNGIGIKPEYHERIFNIFERLHSRVEYEGSGIGLATCKKIVNNVGGHIWLESEEGQGTTFYFTLPKFTAEKVPNIENFVDVEEGVLV